ncbi:MAG: AAA family ATPase [Actinomycetota bacterium]
MDTDLRETHSAVVALVGSRAYKTKKPVRLAFLDFSTPEARWAVAAREVELNRRLAPDVYLGVGEWRDPDAPPDRPGEPVVVMRRLPDDRRLATLVTEHVGGANRREELQAAIRAIARILAAFHSRAERSPEIDTAGLPETLLAQFAANVDEARGVGSGVLDPTLIDEIEARGRTYLRGRAPLLAQRVGDGLVCDGHGDLLTDDIFCLPDGPRILDCIEFDDRLRWGDVLADVAFLVMDLERLGAPDLAAQLLDDYREFSGEHHPTSLAHFFVASRALVRAKVTAIRVYQGERSAAPLATQLLELAATHLRLGRVTCTLVGGAPGAGKSTLAQTLAPSIDAVVIASDEVRKDLAGLAHDARGTSAYGTGIYDDAHTEATYAEMIGRARHLLEHGTSVVLDASWSRHAHRDAARAAAVTTGAELRELRCVAPAAVTHRRIAARASQPHTSDATVAIATTMTDAAEPWPTAVTLDTDAPPFVVAAAAERAIG